MSETLAMVLASSEAMADFLDAVADHQHQGDGGVHTNCGFCSPEQVDAYVRQEPVTSREEQARVADIIAEAVQSYN